MSKPSVAVFTATSNTGGAALESLVASHLDQVNVRAVVRTDANVAALQSYASKCMIIKGDITRPQMLGPVLTGCKAAYFAIPSQENRFDLSKKFIDACIEFGIEYAVVVSVLGADSKETAYQRSFFEIEQYAKSKAGSPVKFAVGDQGKTLFKPVILRCALFYQNFYGSYLGMREGNLYYPLGDGNAPGRIAHIDFHDVGKCIAVILSKPEAHANKVYNLVGEYQSGSQVAGAITMHAGLGVKYHDVDDATTVAAFEALGLLSWIAKGNVEMLKWFREGRGQDVASDVLAITGKAPTKFGSFVKLYLKPLLV